MNHEQTSRKYLILILFLFSCFFSYSQTKYAIGFRLLNRIPGEHYVIRVNTPPESALLGEPIFLDIDTTGIVYTGAIYPTGISIFFIQESGPRTCYFNGHEYGTVVVNNANATVDLDCSSPVSGTNDRSIILSTSKPGPGESFEFVIEKNERRITYITLNENNYQNVATGKLFTRGDTLRFTQSIGPRVCNAARTYIIPDTGDLRINLNCGTPPAPKDRAVILSTTKPGPGESFEFIIEKNERRITYITLNENNYQNVATGKLFARGDTLRFTQSIGPRVCNVARTYIIPDTGDLRINLNCGASAPGTGGNLVRVMTQRRPGVSEAFGFELSSSQGKDTTTINYFNGSEGSYFNKFYKLHYFAGDTLRLRQITGNVQCNISPYYIMGSTETTIKVNCPYPYPGDTIPHRVGIKMPVMDAGPYSFKITGGNNVTGYMNWVHSARDTFYFTANFFKGERILLSQNGGPQTVQFSPAPPIVMGSTDLIINALLPGAGKSKLSGTYSGPAGSTIVIRSGANDELTLRAGNGGTTGFRFPKEYDAGDTYSLSIKTPPPNCNCAILPAASGTMPVDSLELRIVCNVPIELVSRSTDNKLTNTFYETSAPVVGGKGADEGRYVAFVSSGTGLDGASGKYRQIFWRDMRSGTTKMISRSPDGSEGDKDSFSPAISADGKSVAFESYSTNLGTGDNNGVRDIYVWKDGGGIRWVSAGGNAESYEPMISGDGSAITFSSSASTLAAGVDGTSMVNVFLSKGGSSQLISKDAKTGKALGGSAPHISEDGNKLVFCSFSDKLVANDKNALWDIFLWQNGNPQLRKLSNTSDGGDRDQGTESASRVVAGSISGNGNYIVYSTTATNMVGSDNNKMQDIFICDIGGGGVRRLSVTANNTEGDGDSPIDQGGRIGISYDGKWIIYNTNASNLGVAKGNIILQNTRTGKIIPVTNSIYNTSGRPMLSRDGNYVVAGCSEKLDKRFISSGIFWFFLGEK